MTPSRAFEWFVVAWLTAMAALIAYRLLTGRIRLDGLFTMDGRRFSPERMQLLLITVGALVVYAGEALAANKFPTVPDGLLPIVVGSNAVYLAGKIAGR